MMISQFSPKDLKSAPRAKWIAHYDVDGRLFEGYEVDGKEALVLFCADVAYSLETAEELEASGEAEAEEEGRRLREEAINQLRGMVVSLEEGGALSRVRYSIAESA
jgi:hypothetical protein